MNTKTQRDRQVSDEARARWTTDTAPPYRCNVIKGHCGRAFPTFDGVKMHAVRAHVGSWDTGGNFKKRGASNGTLATAVAPPAPDDPKRCPVCMRHFNTRAYMTMHLRKAHKRSIAEFEPATFRCKAEGCDFTSTTRSGVAKHAIARHGRRASSARQKQYLRKKQRFFVSRAGDEGNPIPFPAALPPVAAEEPFACAYCPACGFNVGGVTIKREEAAL